MLCPIFCDFPQKQPEDVPQEGTGVKETWPQFMLLSLSSGSSPKRRNKLEDLEHQAVELKMSKIKVLCILKQMKEALKTQKETEEEQVALAKVEEENNKLMATGNQLRCRRRGPVSLTVKLSNCVLFPAKRKF